jgi:isopropylmalate/homocitrate/citramalate synthase
LVDFGEERWDLKGLLPLYDLVSRTCRIPIPKNAPIVGENAFTHCAGVHTQAAKLNPRHYESLAPERFGRSSFVSLDHMSGRSSVLSRLEDIGVLNPDRMLVETVLQRVKEIGQSGRTVADDELEQMVRYIRSPAQDVTPS